MNVFHRWKNYIPGMRAFKTAIAVFCCVAISGFVPTVSPFFMALAAIITMQVSTVHSFKMGQTRILGTAVGAMIGLMFALIQPESALFSAIGILLIIQICNKLHLNSAIQIATFVFMAIMVNLNGQDPLGYSVMRLVETSVGVGIGLIVNYFVFPYNNLSVIHEAFLILESLLNEKLGTLIETDAINQRIPIELGDLSPLRKSLLSIRDEIELYKQEARVQRSGQDEIRDYENAYQLYWDIFEHMKHLKLLEEAMSAEYSDFSSEELSVVYQYHLKRIILDLANVNTANAKTAPMP